MNDPAQSEPITDKSDEQVLVDFMNDLFARLDGLEQKVQSQDKALAQALRAIGSLVVDLVIVIRDTSTPEEKTVASGRIDRFTATIQSSLEKA